MKLSLETLRPMLEKLLSRSRANEVNWAPPTYKTDPWQEYHLKLPASTLEVGYRSPASSPDQVGIWLKNSDDQIIYGDTFDEGDPDFDFVKELYDDAYRMIMKVDEVFNDLEEQLKKSGPIGL